jgi:hypothetical protein
MQNLIMTCGVYRSRFARLLLRPFLDTLRQHYNGRLVVFTNDRRMKSGVVCEMANPKIDRYAHYLPVLESMPDVDRVLLADMRDVTFHADPFSMATGADLEFFTLPMRICDSPLDRQWIREAFDEDTLEEVEHHTLSCSGTTRGSREAMLHYLREMVAEQGGLHDQAIHNVLLRRGRFNGFRVSESMNGEGAVRTLTIDKELPVDREGQIVNTDGRVVPIVHNTGLRKDFVKKLWREV